MPTLTVSARSLLAEKFLRPDQYRAVLHEIPGSVWHEVEDLALTRALIHALESPYFRRRVDLDVATIERDPRAAVLRFPALTKEVYWRHAEALRLPGYERLLRHAFHTSGTETGVPTEMPWDAWTYERSFGESSALALVRAGVERGDLAIIGSPAIGALGKAFAWAAERLGLESWCDPQAFNDLSVVDTVRERLEQAPGGVVIGAPGPLSHLFQGILDAGVNPRALGIRAIVSGLGTFLTRRHLDFLVQTVDPEVVVEQGGKNEILHAPGATRFHRSRPEKVCSEGFLHYAPWVSHVVAVDAAAFARGKHEPVGHGKKGVLLMSRLSAGRAGIVAYLNDAGDLGETRGPGIDHTSLCSCGCALPAFRFAGRVRDTPTNRLGFTLFPEEFQQALVDACRLAQVPTDVAARLRLQVLLVESLHWQAPDTLFWVFGIVPEDYRRHTGALERALEVFQRCWAWGDTLASYDAFMVFGGGFAIDRAGLPHSGRDKACYRLVSRLTPEGGEEHLSTLRRHVEDTLGSHFLKALPEEQNA